MLDVRLNAGGTVTLSAETIVINTGARPSFPSIPGLDRIPTLTSTSIMELETVPPHLLVLGGGYVGVEFAQMFRRFGSAVTIIQDGPQLLTKEDPDVSEEISKILREDGIDIVVGARVERAELVANGLVQLTFGVGTGTDAQRVTGSHLLVATGRTPNTDRLNLAAADIHASSEGLIEVNDQLATNVPGVYAIGDVTGEPAFTHISYDDYRILKTNLLEGGHASTRGRLIPYTIYIDPQLGRVGLTETEARKQDQPIAVAKLPMNRVARAVEVDEPRGFMKAIVNSKTQQILGVAVLGIEGGELMSMFEVAMLGHLPYPVLREAIFAHPTLAESLNNLFARVG
jgi:pyruvate/2-oxoglutarate dehydrogenase complex dihydrolipoamide dehydrogenase (E3) component